MSVARVAAFAALIVATVLIATVVTGGDQGRRYELLFQTAGQLVTDDDVQVGGRRVGAIERIELTDDNLALVTVRVSEPYAPLHEGTKAGIRLTSLSGIANRYITLTPGPDNGREIPDGGRLGTDMTRSVVDLDQLFNALDPDAREDLQAVVRGFATVYDGKAAEAGESAEFFNPFLSTTRRLVNELTSDEEALTAFIVNSARTVSALAERRDDLSDLVGNANATTRAIASENVSLERALAVLPGTLRRGNTTFLNLRATLDDLDTLVAASKPATKDLDVLFRRLRPLVADARPTIRDLRRLVRRDGRDNDLVEATRKLPGLARVASPAFKSGREALVKAQPVLEFLRPYTPEFAGWIRDFGFNASAYDANGHYARIQPIFNAFSFADNAAGGTLTPTAPSNRFTGLQNGFAARCPGAAIEQQPDKSNPFYDNGGLDESDCDRKAVMPGSGG